MRVVGGVLQVSLLRYDECYWLGGFSISPMHAVDSGQPGNLQHLVISGIELHLELFCGPPRGGVTLGLHGDVRARCYLRVAIHV